MDSDFENVQALLAQIAPSIIFPGRRPFTLAVCITAQLVRTRHLDDILLTKDVHPAVAQQLCSALDSTERAIYRAADACWMGGHNDALNLVIGRVLPFRPKPSELILYCAYYLAYGVPYHRAPEGAPMPF